MKKPNHNEKIFTPFPFKFLIITFFIIFSATSFAKAQQRIVTLSGFTEDVIADTVLNTLPTSLTSSAVDIPRDSGFVFFAQGYSNNSVAYITGGLPANRQFTSSAGHNFQLAPYNTNNDLRLEALQSGTLTFAISDTIAYDTLYVLGAGGYGSPNTLYTVNFTDATTATGSFIVQDWYCNNCTPYAIKNLHRANRINGNFDGIPLGIREYPIALSAGDRVKHIKSITFSVPSGQAGAANIMGITGFTVAALPITLEYFTARVENGKALLQWKTSQEFNNKQFIIERSTSANPFSFVVVGQVNAISSANGAVYHFTNDPGISGTYLYRLIQEDFDGQRKIEGIKSITLNSKAKWAVQDLGYEWKLICEQPFTYRLLDINGRVLNAAAGSGSATISKPASHGIYQIQVQTGGEFSTQKLLK